MDNTSRELDNPTATWSYSEIWKQFPIPARPDTEELSLEEAAMKECGKSPSDIKLMILGSTIEYRSLAKKLGISPVVVDFSKQNFDILSSYAEETFENENFVESDWLEVEYTNQFDFICGHRPFNVVRHDQVEILFTKMYSALQPGGTFFCRGNVLFVDSEIDLEATREKYAFASDRPYPLFSYLEVALYMHCSDYMGYVDYPKAQGIIDDWFHTGKITEQDYKKVRPLISMPAGTKFRSGVKKEELEREVKKAGFQNIEWLFTSHEFTQNMPILKLVK